MEKAGFKVEIMPMPLPPGEVAEMPKTPKFAVDISPDYGHVLSAIEKSLPDIELEVVTGNHRLADYTGMLHFFTDRTMSSSIKRMLLAGRYVISNVQAPYAGFVADDTNQERFIVDVVTSIRTLVCERNANNKARDYYALNAAPLALVESLK